ncbi:MAG: DUF2281 domain-containing protein [Acidobacteria bacterium]|nr:MAG: DUF2281 domain-containing protein [Acidobacteriota bacterium]
MTTRELLLNEIEQTPETLLSEILDFVQFLNIKLHPSFDAAQASELSLAKDWLRPEEDEAWQGL